MQLSLRWWRPRWAPSSGWSVRCACPWWASCSPPSSTSASTTPTSTASAPTRCSSISLSWCLALRVAYLVFTLAYWRWHKTCEGGNVTVFIIIFNCYLLLYVCLSFRLSRAVIFSAIMPINNNENNISLLLSHRRPNASSHTEYFNTQSILTAK